MDDPNPSQVNILLVDDQSVGLLALEAVLRSPEYNLIKANCGEEALKCLMRDDFALILMDVRMPGLDGFETAEMIKTHERSRNIPIIFITGIDEDDRYIHKGYQAGAVDYLFKPFDSEILKSKVAVFIELYKKNETIRKQNELLRKSMIAQLELESLKRYRILADAIPHMVWEAKPDGTLGYLNKSWCDYTQLTVEQSLDQGWQSMVEPTDLKKLLETWDLAMKTGSSFEIECRIKRGRDAMYRWHLILMIPEKAQGDEITAWVGTGTDIHDRKEIENAILKASRAAQDATRTKSEFLATMSHEIRTPLNAIIGMTRLLLETTQTVEQADFSETIRRSGETLLHLINNILDFSKIESGKMELEVSDFSLESIFHDCDRTFRSMISNKGLQLQTEIPKDIPVYLKGDSIRIQQILRNLINNAIKFTHTGSVSISVQLLSTDQNTQKAKLRFKVKDTGIGIPQASMSRLFQSFSQADSSTTRRFGGTGLGLSISKRLVDLMGGQIGVESEEGIGSSFWFVIELEKSEARLPLVSRTKRIKLKPQVATGRILIAEDNLANQKLALKVLESMGYLADAVINGFEVLDALRATHYDLILMDWHMPEMDGLEATRLIRASKIAGRQDIPIIAMTASAMLGDQEKSLNAGMNDYISKPIDFDLLAQKIERWMPQENEISPDVPSVASNQRPHGVTLPQTHLELIDYSALEKLFTFAGKKKGRQKIISQFIASFFKNVPQRFKDLRNAATKEDSLSFHREAHTLKSNCAYLGIKRMQEICVKLETLSERYPLSQHLPLIQSLEEEYAKAKDALDEISEIIKKSA